MKSKTLLGTLVKHCPRYMKLLMKPNNYEEVFAMQDDWTGIIQFTKKSGRIKDPFHQYISSLITIKNESIVYQENIEYFLIPSTVTPTIVHPTWTKNNTKITSKEIPTYIFHLIALKKDSDTMHSSCPL